MTMANILVNIPETNDIDQERSPANPNILDLSVQVARLSSNISTNISSAYDRGV